MDTFVSNGRSFAVVRMPGDCSCMFHALSTGLQQLQVYLSAAQLRALAATLVMREWISAPSAGDMANFPVRLAAAHDLTVDDVRIASPQNYEQFILTMRAGRYTTYGSAIEMVALCNHFNMRCSVYDYGTKQVVMDTSDTGGATAPRGTTYLLHYADEHGAGVHYDVLQPLPRLQVRCMSCASNMP